MTLNGYFSLNTTLLAMISVQVMQTFNISITPRKASYVFLKYQTDYNTDFIKITFTSYPEMQIICRSLGMSSTFSNKLPRFLENILKEKEKIKYLVFSIYTKNDKN